MAVWFRLLGEVSVTDDGRPVDIGPRQLRTVLAVLVMSANKVVPWEVMVDRAWGERTPRQARETLYTYLSRLRTALGDGPAKVITLRNGGCSLSVDEATVDVYEFRRLRAEAEAARDDRQAADLLAKALDLWTGDAFADIDTPWFARGLGEAGADRVRANAAANTPLKVASTADDIAAAAVFLASRASRHVTGETLLVDAGSHLGYAPLVAR